MNEPGEVEAKVADAMPIANDAASHRERRQRKLINKFLTFRKIASKYLVFRKTVHTAMVASIASPIVTRTLTAVEQPCAPIAHPLCDLISPEAVEKAKMA